MPKENLKKAIVIGGSDPSGGAGIQADLYTLHQLKIPAVSVITAITAQNGEKFFSYQSVSAQNFKDQLSSISQEAKGGIVKIGMLGNSDLISPLQNWLKEVKPKFAILDPVIRSTTKADLIDSKGIELIRSELIYSVDLLTPNLSELSILSERRVTDLAGMQKAAMEILKISTRKRSKLKWILAKGGHLQGDPIDLLMGKNKLHSFGRKRIPFKEAHGTGCTLASAIAGYLWKGKKLKEAIVLARRTVLKKIEEN